ncbi:MAG: monofunctional biosynthetic peptidoglycan transglycosylase [Bacteroidota bacterium]
MRSPRLRVPLRSIWRALRIVGICVLSYLGLCAMLTIAYRWVDPPVTAVHVQRWVELGRTEGYDFRYAPRDLAAISDHVEHAVVAAEDGRFYTHNGFDWTEIQKAYDEYRSGERRRGASTISQQVARNLFLGTWRSPIRKGLEIPFTAWLEFVLPKDRILELYLNIAEWGPAGIFGVEAAAQYHYNRSAAEVSRAQAARLAAILPSPRTRRPQEMHRYSGIIERRMTQMGW